MPTPKRFAPSIALALVLVASPTAFAHSIEDLESALGDKEAYFQAADKDAPAFSLQTADGEVVRLADLRGKVVILNFIYTSCPDVCPLHTDRMAEIQEMVNLTPMRELVQFVTITTDPVNDTPEVLRDYGEAHGLDPANWSFLTSAPDQPEDTTRLLAQSYGHKFDKTQDEYQVHGVVTHVIDKDGQWRGNFHGLKFDPLNLLMFVNALTNDTTAPHGHGESNWWTKIKSLF